MREPSGEKTEQLRLRGRRSRRHEHAGEVRHRNQESSEHLASWPRPDAFGLHPASDDAQSYVVSVTTRGIFTEGPHRRAAMESQTDNPIEIAVQRVGGTRVPPDAVRQLPDLAVDLETTHSRRRRSVVPLSSKCTASGVVRASCRQTRAHRRNGLEAFKACDLSWAHKTAARTEGCRYNPGVCSTCSENSGSRNSLRVSQQDGDDGGADGRRGAPISLGYRPCLQ